MRAVVLTAVLTLSGCYLPKHRLCPTGVELHLAGEQSDFDGEFGGSGESVGAGVTIYYDLTGECDAAR